MGSGFERSTSGQCTWVPLFNIFINDLFYHITEVKLQAYADDEQSYDSDTDPKLLDWRHMHQLNIANEWYRSNGMLVNPTKHQAMKTVNTDHVFSFPVQKSVELFGITVDDGLCFDEHVFRDGPLEKLWGGGRGRAKYKKKFMQGKIK